MSTDPVGLSDSGTLAHDTQGRISPKHTTLLLNNTTEGKLSTYTENNTINLYSVDDHTIYPKMNIPIPTGIFIDIPIGCCGLITLLSKTNTIISNTQTIYPGDNSEIIVYLKNDTHSPIKISKDIPISEITILKICKPIIVKVDSL